MKQLAIAAQLLAGLCLFGACANDQLEGCQKDDDCADGRICEAGACTWIDGAGAAGAAGAGCAETGASCSVNADCCNFQSSDGFCVSGTCADACGVDGDCASNCCAPLQSGGRACAPLSICEQSCVDAGQSCSVNADCCNFRDGGGLCVDGTCADTCEIDDDCVATGCCAELQSGGKACAPIEICL